MKELSIPINCLVSSALEGEYTGKPRRAKSAKVSQLQRRLKIGCGGPGISSGWIPPQPGGRTYENHN